MGTAFKGLGKGFAEKLISTTSNPFISLFIGLLSTSIVQSSSCTTSILVGMVASGTITIQNAIPFVMGANIGTTITNTFVSMGHITRKQEFERAFAAGVVHDFFNILSVILLLPLHLITQVFMGKGILQIMSEKLADIFIHTEGVIFPSPLKVIVEPFIKLIYETIFPSILSLFINNHLNIVLSIFTLLFSLAMLFLALLYMVKFMKATIMGKVESLFDTYIFKTPIRGFCVGAILTGTIQSSSATTSLIVPMVGTGILKIEQIYSYTLGANIGTTITAILASLVTGSKLAITVAFAHLCFNILGTCIWYPLRIVPITLAKKLAQLSTKSKKYAFIYVITMFFIIPGLLILLTR
jgi:sodium-dependent phosphate cotransporter